MSRTPIADHALLSDCHSAALVDRAGSVEWLGFPRFDSPSVFGRLLDDGAGHFALTPQGPTDVTRAYRDGTMVLETTFTGAEGTVVLADALAVGPHEHGHELGLDVPHLLVRELRCTAGAVEVAVEFAPRPEYGLIVPLLSQLDGGLGVRGGTDWFVLSTPVLLEVERGTARGTLTLQVGETARFGLQRSTLQEEAARVHADAELAAALVDTTHAWRSWAELHQSYEGPWADLVHHSGRVLQALTYRPSGAMVAAATTSLPEVVGGARNWDYRYCWVRDASFTMEALWVAACPDEAAEYFAFMTSAAAGTVGPDAPLQIMYGVGGEHDLSERPLGHLSGWRDSAPVRVGNGAWSQQQIDVYGELLGAAYRFADRVAELDDESKAFLATLADVAAVRWKDTDQGIWEVRGDAQHFTYSKVMCWVALQRAVEMAGALGADADRVGRWQAEAEVIRAEVLDQGYSEEAGAFTQSFGSTALDASTLMIPIVGFLPPDDPRVLSTLDAVQERLTDDNGLVYRYRNDDGGDGLEGEEGTFLLCTFWLAQALAMAGRTARARAVMERALAYISDVGLLAEEVDPATGELLGNIPQAFSHIGLVNAAYAIGEAERRAA